MTCGSGVAILNRTPRANRSPGDCPVRVAACGRDTFGRCKVENSGLTLRLSRTVTSAGFCGALPPRGPPRLTRWPRRRELTNHMSQTVLLERLDLEGRGVSALCGLQTVIKLDAMVALTGRPDLLDRLLRPNDATLSAELAAFFLNLDFDASERSRIDKLAEKSNTGTLTPEE